MSDLELANQRCETPGDWHKMNRERADSSETDGSDDDEYDSDAID